MSTNPGAYLKALHPTRRDLFFRLFIDHEILPDGYSNAIWIAIFLLRILWHGIFSRMHTALPLWWMDTPSSAGLLLLN
jgi:hypothetical protein